MTYIHDHNHWKLWPYWAKGGTIAGVIAFLFILFQFVLVPSLFYGTCGGVPCMMSFARFIENIFTYSMTPLWSSPLAQPMFDNQFVYVIVALAYYFVIGAFVGLMIEKSRKS